jgi:hypothetical protein
MTKSIDGREAQLIAFEDFGWLNNTFHIPEHLYTKRPIKIQSLRGILTKKNGKYEQRKRHRYLNIA